MHAAPDDLQFDVHGSGQASVYLPNESAALALGARLSQVLYAGLVVYLTGPLGAGKTTLARGILRGLGYTGKVKSPTFTLVEVYRLSNLYLHHFDFYRFKQPQEWSDAGFRDMFGGEVICLVEWPEKAGTLLPAADLEVTMEHEGAGRRVGFAACSQSGLECMRHLIAQ